MDKPESATIDMNTEQHKQVNDISQDSEDEKMRQEQLYIVDPHQFLDFCQKDKKIKVMDECNPIMDNVYLKDISLHKKGPLEDKIYSKNTFYYCNIRRGNTLCQIYDQNQKEVSLFMCRRGMKKFYDLEPEYLKLNRKLTHQHERYRRRIFEKLDSYIWTLEENPKSCVNLYGIFKQNGEHCQVSYVKQLGYWLFASKNVAILAKVEDDLNSYQKQRFYWAKLIGKQFFKIIRRFQAHRLEQFINQFQGKTLLGEYCGYEEHQHITKYEKIQLIFYGLVETNGKDHCLPVQQCSNFLSKYGLKMSKVQKLEGLRQKNKIYFSMHKMLKKVAEGSMSQFGQGSVLYFVGDDGLGTQKTIGMCKLKTCEYLIYRKMREMIKIYFARKGATANNFEKFKFEITNLCKNYFSPPKALDYYEEIAEKAFHEIKKNQTDFSDDQFRYKFVNFLESIEKKTMQRKERVIQKQGQISKARRVVLICPPLLTEETQIIQEICKKAKIQIQYSYRQIPNQKLSKSVIHIVHMVPRLNLEEIQQNVTIISYESSQSHSVKSVNELSNTQDIKKSHLISFIKSEDKKKSIQLLKQKIKNFAESISEPGRKHPFQFVAAKDIEDIAIQIQGDSKEKENQWEGPKIYVIITLLIPGSGKSCLAEMIQREYPHLNIDVISSDKIRQAIMAKYQGKRKGQGHEVEIEQAFAAVKKKALAKYREVVMGAVQQCPSQQKILFIDRVFCPTTVLENIRQINREWTKFIIVTQIENPVKLNQHIYSHSVTYLLRCIKRSLQRTGHETLSQKPNQIIKVLLKFYQMYKGFSYSKLARQLKNNRIRFQILPLDFVRQRDSNDNLFLKKKVEQCLRVVQSGGNEPPDSPIYTELIEMMYKYKQHIEETKQIQQEASKEESLKMNAAKIITHYHDH